MQSDIDLKKAAQREAEHDLMASRVISKFNQNSQRILHMAKKEKVAKKNEFAFSELMDRKDRLRGEHTNAASDEKSMTIDGENDQGEMKNSKDLTIEDYYQRLMRRESKV